MKVKYIIYSILPFLLFLYAFVVYKTDFDGADEPIYSSYTASIVEDGDLNVINQANFMSSQPRISKTYNMPDFHNHGGVISWAPFYIYAKSIYFIAKKFNLKSLTSIELDKLVRCAMSFSTVVFSFLASLLTYFFCRVFFSNKLSIWSTVIIFFGTTFFYYTVYEAGNAQMVASLLSIISIWFCSSAINMKRLHWVFYGLFFSICMAVKIDLWFQIFFVFFLFVSLLTFKQTNWKNGVYFIIGLLPGITLKIINDYIKYGTLHIGELHLLNFRDFYFFDQLFSSYRGFFFTSPIFYICLLGLIFSIINLTRNIKTRNERKMQDLFFFILSLYVLIKVFILSYRYAWGGGTPGARILSTEFPIFVLLFARAFQGQKRYIRYFLAFISIFFILWNFIIISEYIAQLDLNYVRGFPKLAVRVKTLQYIFSPLFYIKDLDLKLRSCLPLLLATFVVTFYIIKRFASPISPQFWYSKSHKQTPFRTYIIFTIYLFTAYTIVTLLNIYNNPRNAERLKQEGFFKNVELLTPLEFEKKENAGSLDEMIIYYELKGNMDKVDKIKRMKKKLYNE
ncbi:MAG: hypothetical protein NTW64_01620 [Candidatus Omnitrophica bacterium]|nr:hypothetical protein [Candidatus Omnitrophota bacterium]